MTDLLKPDRARPRVAWQLRRTRIRPQRLGGYALLECVASGPGDACHVGVLDGPTGFDKHVFVRSWTPPTITPADIDRYKRLSTIRTELVETTYDFGYDGERAYVTSDLFVGHALDVVAQHVRVPWSVALALLHDALRRLAAARAIGELPIIAPQRFLCTMQEELALTHGRHGGGTDWRAAVDATARLAMHLAATAEERALLASIDDVSVACDALVERHPELAPALPAMLAGLDATSLVAERVSQRELAGFWDAVAAIS